MRIAIRVVLVLAGVIVALFAVVMVAAETREVIVLHTTGADGASHTTRLWIVDDADGAWLLRSATTARRGSATSRRAPTRRSNGAARRSPCARFPRATPPIAPASTR